jgi:hypothetical protein
MDIDAALEAAKRYSTLKETMHRLEDEVNTKRVEAKKKQIVRIENSLNSRTGSILID